MSRRNLLLATVLAASLLLGFTSAASALSGIVFLNPGVNYTASAVGVQIENAATNAPVVTADMTLTFSFNPSLMRCGQLTALGNVTAVTFANVVPNNLPVTAVNLPWSLTSPNCELLFILSKYALPVAVLGVSVNLGLLGVYTGFVNVGLVKDATAGNLSVSCHLGVLDSLLQPANGFGPTLRILLPQLFDVTPCVPFELLL